MAFLDMNEKVHIELLSRKWGDFFFGKSEQSSLFIKVHFDSETLNSSLAKWDPDIPIFFKKVYIDYHLQPELGVMKSTPLYPALPESYFRVCFWPKFFLIKPKAARLRLLLEETAESIHNYTQPTGLIILSQKFLFDLKNLKDNTVWYYFNGTKITFMGTDWNSSI